MKRLFLTLIFIAFLISITFAQGSDEYEAKSLGMGEVFVTLDGNGETYFFNPATLVLKKYPQLSLSFDYPYKDNLNLKLNYFYPSTSFFAISVNLIYDIENNSYNFENWKGGIAFPLTPNLSFGTSFQFLKEENSLKGNLGLMINLWGTIRAGLVGYGYTVKKVSDKEYLLTLPEGYAIGLSLKPFSSTSLYVDLVDVVNYNKENSWEYLRFGLEQWIGNFLALRWGSIGDITNPLNYTLGVGLRLNILQIDFATLLGPIINQQESNNQKYKITGSIRF
ncbi:MAG: hypothetical protein CBR30_04790 [Dictyoglomus sp. NZ13-RE01]|nr:MAG: hypothetical protein CBR30_04790 [Dictyoglomus sp. NZ13-RE01]